MDSEEIDKIIDEARQYQADLRRHGADISTHSEGLQLLQKKAKMFEVFLFDAFSKMLAHLREDIRTMQGLVGSLEDIREGQPPRASADEAKSPTEETTEDRVPLQSSPPIPNTPPSVAISTTTTTSAPGAVPEKRRVRFDELPVWIPEPGEKDHSA
ncbi:hypothetical protein AAE478_004070 [Parahypoxylon ruwenzoriense]